MSCTFCKQSGSKLASHYLCEMCLVHLECCEATAEDLAISSNRAVPGEDAIRNAECDICLEEYQEDELQEHRETCMARLVFQCSVCAGEYISKEGLWNHLDSHEIADDSKQLHFKEIRVTHKLHKCVLCNDQRGYQESYYWEHVHENHDGFFLRCSECGDCFRSQKLKTDHAVNHCKAREQTVPLSSYGFEVDEKCIIDLPLPAETTALMSCEVLNLQNLVDGGEQSSIENYEEKTDICIEFDSPQRSQFAEEPTENSRPSSNISDEADNDNVKKDSGMPPASSKCQVTAQENLQPLVEESDTKCPHCNKCYQDNLDLVRHIDSCHEPTACDICGTISTGRNKNQYHKLNCSLETRKDITSQESASNMDIEDDNHMNYDQEHVEHQFEKEPIESICSSLNDADDNKITNEKPNESSTTAGNFVPLEITKCADCGKECYEPLLLRHHIAVFHEVVDCKICGISISSRSRLKYHKLTNHSEPRFKCPHCPKTSYLKKSFKNHLASHVEERKFACEICGNMFKSLHYVSLHMYRTHHIKGAWKKVNASVSACNKQQRESCDDSMAPQTENVANDEETTSLETAARVPDDNGGESSTVVCLICGMSFASTDQLQDHKVTCFLNTKKISQEIASNIDADIDSTSNYLMSSDQEHVELQFKEDPTESVCPSSNIPGATDQIKIEETSLSLVENPPSESSKLKCPHCDKLYEDILELIPHIENCHEPTACDICGTISTGRNQNRYHKLKHHRDPKYKCPHCPVKLHIKGSYLCHLASHVQEKKFACEICGSKFKNLSYVDMHMRRTHHVKAGWKKLKTLQTDSEGGGEQSSTVCTICEKTFASTDQLQDHKLNCSLDTRKEIPSQEPASNIDIEDINHMNSDQEHVEHQFEKEPTESISSSFNDADDSNITNESSTTAEHLVPLETTRCTVCDKEFYDKSLLTNHNAFFHEEVDCDICGISINNRSRLRYHKLKSHSEPRLGCPYCPKKYHTKSHLKSHYQNHHPGKKIPSLLRKSQLFKKLHKVKSETNSKGQLAVKWSKTKCPHCDKRFKDKSELTRHVENFHEPIMCGICGVTSTGRAQDLYHKLKGHSKVEHKCPHCQMKFLTNKSYQKHLASHDSKLNCSRDTNKIAAPTPEVVASNMDAEINSTHESSNDQEYVERQVKENPDLNITDVDPPATSKSQVNAEGNPLSLFENSSSESSTLKCLHCDRLYHDQFELLHHIENCHKPYTCSICKTTFAGKNKYRYHKLTNHSEPKYKCPHCAVKFHLKKSYQVHLASHVSGRKFACEICGNKYTNQYYVSLHMSRTHHIKGAYKKVNASFSISNKQQQGSSDDSMALKTENVTSSEQTKSLKTTLQISDDNGGESLSELMNHELIVCIICGMSFANTNQLKNHKFTCFLHANKISTPTEEIVSDINADIESSNVSSNYLMSSNQEHVKPQFNEDPIEGVCPSSHIPVAVDEIKIEQTSLSPVENSTSVENSSSQVKCPHCVKQFHTLDLTRHIENTHKPILCDICGTTSFGRPQNRYHKLKYHMEPMYKCSQCSKKYVTKQSYQSHLASHVQERNFPCEICGQKFKNSYYVSMHLSRTHHVKGAWKKVKASVQACQERESFDDLKTLQTDNAPSDAISEGL